jgi:transcription elongation factor SPT5
MIDKMMHKYQDSEEDELQDVDAGGVQVKVKSVKQGDDPSKYEDIVQDIVQDDEADDLSRDICLPSIKDSKLWRIKVTPGRERELIFKITNKLVEYLNNGDPLNVLDVFESQVCQGIIYCEAFKS